MASTRAGARTCTGLAYEREEPSQDGEEINRLGHCSSACMLYNICKSGTCTSDRFFPTETSQDVRRLVIISLSFQPKLYIKITHDPYLRHRPGYHVLWDWRSITVLGRKSEVAADMQQGSEVVKSCSIRRF